MRKCAEKVPGKHKKVRRCIGFPLHATKKPFSCGNGVGVQTHCYELPQKALQVQSHMGRGLERDPLHRERETFTAAALLLFWAVNDQPTLMHFWNFPNPSRSNSVQKAPQKNVTRLLRGLSSRLHMSPCAGCISPFGPAIAKHFVKFLKT